MRSLSKQITTILTIGVFTLGSSVFMPLAALAKDGSDDSGTSSGSTDQTPTSSSDTQTTTSSHGSHGEGADNGHHGKKTVEKVHDFAQDAEVIQKTEKSETEVESELADNEHELQHVEVPKVDSTKIGDFEDADKTVTELETASDTLAANAELEHATQSLPTTDQTLLHQVVNKHRTESTLVQADLQDVKKQVRELHDLLQQTKGQKLTSDVKQVLLEDLQGLKDEIKTAKDLAQLNVQLVQAETK